MSTDATSADKPVSSAGSTVIPTSPLTSNKGKGKGKDKVEEVEEDEDDEEEEDEDDDMDDDEDEDEEDGFDEIDPGAILPTGRRTRGVKVDYTSSEALRKAGLKPGDELEDEGEDSFAHDDDAMKG